jgi:hypothetical protein
LSSDCPSTVKALALIGLNYTSPLPWWITTIRQRSGGPGRGGDVSEARARGARPCRAHHQRTAVPPAPRVKSQIPEYPPCSASLVRVKATCVDCRPCLDEGKRCIVVNSPARQQAQHRRQAGSSSSMQERPQAPQRSRPTLGTSLLQSRGAGFAPAHWCAGSRERGYSRHSQAAAEALQKSLDSAGV